MKISTACSKLAALMPCVALMTLGTATLMADPPERTGSDAPHQERNLAKNERKTALSLSQVTVPAFADTQKPVRKATAVHSSSTAQKSKDKKKAAQQQAQVKEKPKAEAVVADTVQERPRYDYDVEDRVGGDAPHQERSADPNKRAARLFILER